MHPNVIYRACDVAVNNHITPGEAEKILALFVKGGVIEQVNGDRLFKTKQKALQL
jgi:hypothetical protein